MSTNGNRRGEVKNKIHIRSHDGHGRVGSYPPFARQWGSAAMVRRTLAFWGRSLRYEEEIPAVVSSAFAIGIRMLSAAVMLRQRRNRSSAMRRFENHPGAAMAVVSNDEVSSPGRKQRDGVGDKAAVHLEGVMT